MTRVFRLLALLACAAPAFAAPPDPVPAPKPAAAVPADAPKPAPVPVPPAKPPEAPLIEGVRTAPYLVELKIRNVPQGTAVIWDVFPEETATTRIVKAERAILIAGPPGEYRVKCRLIKGEDVVELRDSAVLTGGKKPVPKPDDKKTDPEPDDKKPAKVARLRTVFVSESGDLGTWKSAFLGDKDAVELYAARKWDAPWWIDPNDTDPLTGKTPAKWKHYVERAAALKLKSALFLTNPDTGDVLYEGEPPATPAEITKLLKDKTSP